MGLHIGCHTDTLWHLNRWQRVPELVLPPSERPQSDDEKRDQWMIRFSRAVGKNLAPFFEYWGIPTSAKARQAIADLPVWMPQIK